MAQQAVNLTRNSLFMMGIFFGGYLLLYGMNVTLARMLGPMDYGNYKVAEAFFKLGAIIAIMGGANAVAKFLVDHIKDRNSEKIGEFVRFYFVLALVVSICISLLVFWGNRAEFKLFDGEGYHPVLLATWIIPILAASSLICGIFQVSKRLDLAFIPARIINPILITILCTAYYYIFGNLNGQVAIAAALTVELALLVWLFFKSRSLGLIAFGQKTQTTKPASWLKVSIPLMIVFVMQTMMRQIDIYMIEYMAGEASVGHFAAAQTISMATGTARIAVYALLTPMAVNAIKAGYSQIAPLNWTFMKVMFISIIIVGGVTAFFGHPILELFGHDSESAYRTLIYLILGAVFHSIFGLPAVWLQYSGHEKTVMTVLVLSIVLNGVLNALLIPVFEIEGAAISTCISLVVSSAILTIKMYSSLKILPWSGCVFVKKPVIDQA